jgi:hypothetical protein
VASRQAVEEIVTKWRGLEIMGKGADPSHSGPDDIVQVEHLRCRILRSLWKLLPCLVEVIPSRQSR